MGNVGHCRVASRFNQGRREAVPENQPSEVAHLSEPPTNETQLSRHRASRIFASECSYLQNSAKR